MRDKTVLIIAAGLFLAVSIAIAAQNTGDEMIILEGGKSGNVPFPHKVHQDSLKDCNVCHDVFPQEKGSIEKLKEEGKLRKKQVMNIQCLKCHRDAKKAGKPSGPTSWRLSAR